MSFYDSAIQKAQILATDITSYLHGKCHILAVAMHRRYGMRMLLLVDTSSIYTSGVPAVQHVYACDANGVLHDVLGPHDADNVISQWTYSDDDASTCEALWIDDEEDLGAYVGSEWDHPLTAYTDEDVEAAELVMDVVYAASSSPST